MCTKKESFTKNPPGEVKLFLECRIIRGWSACRMKCTWQRCSLASALFAFRLGRCVVQRPVLAKSGGYFLTPPPGASLEGSFRFLQPPKRVFCDPRRQFLLTNAALFFDSSPPRPFVCGGIRRAPESVAPPPKFLTRSLLNTVLPQQAQRTHGTSPGCTAGGEDVQECELE